MQDESEEQTDEAAEATADDSTAEAEGADDTAAEAEGADDGASAEVPIPPTRSSRRPRRAVPERRS